MYSILTRLLWYGKIPLPAVLLALLLTPTYGQVVQTNRYELTIGELEPEFEVTAGDDKGVFIYRPLTLLDQINDALEIAFIDTTLQQKWHGYIALEKNYQISGHRFFGTTLYLILRYRDYSKNDFQILAINYENGSYINEKIRNFIPFNPTEFYITSKAALIGGYFNKTPVVIYYDLATKKTRVVPGLFNEPGELTQIKTYPNGSFDILVSAKNMAHKKTMWIRNYDDDGSIIKNIMLEPDGNKNLIFGRSLKTTDDMQLVAGVYSNHSIEFSKGIFIASINALGEQKIRYYNYGDLQNFFKYMRARKEIRIKNRIERRKIKGRKIRFNYKLLVHELIPYHDQFILLGEAFYPKYNYNNGYGGFFAPTYGSSALRYPNYQNGKVFDGYYYTHAVVIGFDKDGKLIWDNSFEINDVRTFKLEQFVKLDATEDNITLLYLFDNEIRSKIIKDNSVIEGKLSAPIKLNSETDFTKRKDGGDMSTLDYWYGNYFIAHGTQYIGSLQKSGFAKRKVFFINKITHH